jgi:RNA polymerase sigma-70 factor (ECF subfamily)
VTVTSTTGWHRRFEEHRPHLRTVAYRMLGSVTESDDALQEAWLRLSRADRAARRQPRRLADHGGRAVCLDMLRSRRARREDYVGSWLPEPVVSLDESTNPRTRR